MSAAGFFMGTMSPASTKNLADKSGPTTCSSTALTASSAEVEATARAQPASAASCAVRRTPGRPGRRPSKISSL